MAKRITSAKAFEFVFDAEHLKEILDRGPDKVLFTVSIETAVTKDNQKVGALKIKAKGTFKGKATRAARGDDGALGCPIPPCVHN
ncbi:MAG: hypothetical protein JSU09_16355 [Bacteroidetes bacterium]|nr:hypothetical protein [Bacteroidota bacterium]